MTVKLDFIQPAILARGVVHEHHVIVFQVVACKTLVELLRSVGAGVDRIAVFVAAGPGELHGRLAEIEGKYTVYLA